MSSFSNSLFKLEITRNGVLKQMRLKSQSLLLTIDYVPALKHELTQGRSNTIVKYKRRQSDEDCPIRSIIYKFVEIKILYQIM